jgi:hypothetical protein
MLASDIPREQWEPFLEGFNRQHSGRLVRVERHQPGLGIIFEVESCIFERIHDDQSGERHRIGVIVGEPNQRQETFFMTDPRQLLWFEDDAIHTLRIEGTDGRFLVVRLLAKTRAAA